MILMPSGRLVEQRWPVAWWWKISNQEKKSGSVGCTSQKRPTPTSTIDQNPPRRLLFRRSRHHLSQRLSPETRRSILATGSVVDLAHPCRRTTRSAEPQPQPAASICLCLRPVSSDERHGPPSVTAAYLMRAVPEEESQMPAPATRRPKMHPLRLRQRRLLSGRTRQSRQAEADARRLALSHSDPAAEATTTAVRCAEIKSNSNRRTEWLR